MPHIFKDMGHIYFKTMNFNKISEIINLLINEQIEIIEEAKIDTLIQQYQSDEKMFFWLSLIKDAKVEPKFLNWLVKQGKQISATSETDMANMFYNEVLPKIKKFEELSKKNRLPIEHKDINRISDLEMLQYIIELGEEKARNKEKSKENKKNVKVIYSDAKYLLVEPETYEASCKYGAGTRWCIASNQTDSWFNEYKNRKSRFIFVIEKSTNDKDAIVFHDDVSDIYIYDNEDDSKDSNYIENKYPKEILYVINKYLKSNGHQSSQYFKKLEDIINSLSTASIEDFSEIITSSSTSSAVAILIEINKHPELLAKFQSSIIHAIRWIVRNNIKSKSIADENITDFMKLWKARLLDNEKLSFEKKIVTLVLFDLLNYYNLSSPPIVPFIFMKNLQKVISQYKNMIETQDYLSAMKWLCQICIKNIPSENKIFYLAERAEEYWLATEANLNKGYSLARDLEQAIEEMENMNWDFYSYAEQLIINEEQK